MSWLQSAHGVERVPQDARERLKSSQHELAAIQKQRDDLARQLALIAEKISSGVIPDPADLAVPDHIAAAAEASASAPRVRLPSESSAALNPIVLAGTVRRDCKVNAEKGAS
jgi:hypothetical protein